MIADVLGQAEVAKKLINAWRKNRLAQAYILHGPDGIGKTPFAIELAKTFLCLKGGTEHALADACDQCPSCRKVQHSNHEDIEVLEPSGPGRVVTFENVNALIEKLKFKTRSGEHRYVIIEEADRVRPETANHFLKTLEEPPTDVTFFLLTARLPALLETIVSRCQVVRMHRTPPAEIERFLLARGAEPEKARLYSRLADGCPGRAANMDGAGTFERRTRLLDWLHELDQTGDIVVASEVLEANRARTLMDTRDNHIANLGLLVTIYRDMTLLAEGADAALLYNPDVADDLRSRAQRVGAARLRTQSLEILDARKNIEGMVSPDLVISQLLADLAV